MTDADAIGIACELYSRMSGTNAEQAAYRRALVELVNALRARGALTTLQRLHPGRWRACEPGANGRYRPTMEPFCRWRGSGPGSLELFAGLVRCAP